MLYSTAARDICHPATAQHEMRLSLGRASVLFARADRQRQMGQPDRSSEFKRAVGSTGHLPSSALSHLQALSNGHRAVWAVVMLFVSADYVAGIRTAISTLCCTAFR